MSQLDPRYPEQEHIRQALCEWAEQQPSLHEAAADLCISYRLLSLYRHGQRWIPDRIAEALEIEPVPMIQRTNRSRISLSGNVVQASLRFVNAIRRRDGNFAELEATRNLIAAVKEYQTTFGRRALGTTANQQLD